MQGTLILIQNFESAHEEVLRNKKRFPFFSKPGDVGILPAQKHIADKLIKCKSCGWNVEPWKRQQTKLTSWHTPHSAVFTTPIRFSAKGLAHSDLRGGSESECDDEVHWVQ
jgi:hypothetical protein